MKKECNLFKELWFKPLTQKEKIETLVLSGIFLYSEEEFFFEILRKGGVYEDFTIEKDSLSFELNEKWQFNKLFKIMCDKNFEAIYDNLEIKCYEKTIKISYKGYGQASPEYFTRWFFAGEIRNNIFIDKDFENIYFLKENITDMFSYAFKEYEKSYFYTQKSNLKYEFNKFMLLYLRTFYPLEDKNGLYPLHRNIFNPTNFDIEKAENELKQKYSTKELDFIVKNC